MVRFNPTAQLTDIDSKTLFSREYPSLQVVAQAYGAGVPAAWLAIQISDLAEYAGCKEKLDKSQILFLARVLATEYKDFTVVEFLEFFRRFKLGHYGTFYGAVDPMKITNAILKYSSDLNKQFEKYKEEQIRQEVAEGQNDDLVYAFWDKVEKMGLTISQWLRLSQHYGLSPELIERGMKYYKSYDKIIERLEDIDYANRNKRNP